jgi:hypothetical protein
MSTRQDTAALPGAAAAPALKAASINETPKPVEAALKVVADMQPAKAGKPQAASSETIAAASIKPTPSRALRFALVAASIAFAGVFGAIAGALGMSLIAPPATTAQVEAIDLTVVQGAMASLRNELSTIKSSVENSNRDVNAQLAKFTERLEQRIPTPARPSAQAPGRAPGDVTGTVRPQALATPSAPRPRVIEGWALRRVSRGTAIIQGHEGAIEVAAGDVVPGIGRIESIRRLDGRWVVLTHGGMITAQPPR